MRRVKSVRERRDCTPKWRKRNRAKSPRPCGADHRWTGGLGDWGTRVARRQQREACDALSPRARAALPPPDKRGRASRRDPGHPDRIHQLPAITLPAIALPAITLPAIAPPRPPSQAAAPWVCGPFPCAQRRPGPRESCPRAPARASSCAARGSPHPVHAGRVPRCRACTRSHG